MRTVRQLVQKGASFLFAVVVVLLLASCASTLQYPPFPDQTRKVEDPSKARIYLIRKEKVWGAGNKFLFYGGDSAAAVGPLVSQSHMRLIGEIGPGSYICWEEPPHPFRYHRVGGDPNTISTIDLVAGNVYFLRIHAGGWLGDKAIVEILDEMEGQQLLKRCEPPNDYRKPK